MDERVKKFHKAWLEFPDENIIDDREGQPIANVKDDLLRFGLKVKHVVRLAWGDRSDQTQTFFVRNNYSCQSV